MDEGISNHSLIHQDLHASDMNVDITNHRWRMVCGRRIIVKEMSTSHVMNCIRAFRRGTIPPNYLGGKDKWLKIFEHELISRQ